MQLKPPDGYRILEPNEIIKDGDIEEASWSHNSWNNGVWLNEIGERAEEFNYKFARKENLTSHPGLPDS